MLSDTSLQFDKLDSIEDGCHKLAQFLKLEKPVSRDVFVSMVEDSTYAANIIMTRESGSFLHHLLACPPRRFNSPTDNPPAATEVIERSNTELLIKAAQSLLVWSGSGAQMASEEVYETRLSACVACPHYVEAPNKLLYKAAAFLSSKGSTKSPNKLCNLCGCVTANKAKLATESCPDDHPERPGYTRWNEVQSKIHIDIDIDTDGDGGTSVNVSSDKDLSEDFPNEEANEEATEEASEKSKKAAKNPNKKTAADKKKLNQGQVPDCPTALCAEYREQIHRACINNNWPPNQPILVVDPVTGQACNCYCR